MVGNPRPTSYRCSSFAYVLIHDSLSRSMIALSRSMIGWIVGLCLLLGQGGLGLSIGLTNHVRLNRANPR